MNIDWLSIVKALFYVPLGGSQGNSQIYLPLQRKILLDLGMYATLKNGAVLAKKSYQGQSITS